MINAPFGSFLCVINYTTLIVQLFALNVNTSIVNTYIVLLIFRHNMNPKKNINSDIFLRLHSVEKYC